MAIIFSDISKRAHTILKLFQEAGTLPVKKLDAILAYCSLGKEPQDDGKEPFSLFSPRLRYFSCNQPLS